LWVLPLCLGTLFVDVAAEAGTPPAKARHTPAQRARSVAGKTSAWRVSVPMEFDLVSETFDARDKGKVREILILRQQGVERVRLEIFDNADRRSTDAWAQGEMAFLSDTAASRTAVEASPAKRPALRLAFDRSPQAYARWVALFAIEDHFVRLTCIDTTDLVARGAFQRALETFTLGDKTMKTKQKARAGGAR